MGKGKELIGVIVSDKMQKTIIVKVLRTYKHKKYNRIIKTYKKYKAHDENNSAKTGDTVSIAETRPLSKDKHFRVVAVLQKCRFHGETVKKGKKNDTDKIDS